MSALRGLGDALLLVAVFCLGFDLGTAFLAEAFAPQTLAQVWSVVHAPSLAYVSAPERIGDAAPALDWGLRQSAFAMFFVPGLLIRIVGGLGAH